MNAPAATSNDAPKKASGSRKRGFLILGTVVVIAAIAYGLYWFLVAQFFQKTDDAYVAGDVVQITSEIAGTVLSVDVDDTQSVKRGQQLVQLDPADAKVMMATAEADLARTVRTVRGLFAQRSQLQSQIAQRQLALKQAQADYERRLSLKGEGAVSGEELNHARDLRDQARAALDGARDQRQSTAVQIDNTTLASHPQVLAAASAVRTAALMLRRSKLEAPVDGVVAKRSVQVGARVAAGAPLMAVVPLDGVWVDANFKEVQLKSMRVGQPVTLHADVYGGDVEYHGKVAGLAAGSGNAFALLPAQNASGNWIKIVQRVPVRILLDPKELHEHPLRIGLSMAVSVDIRDARDGDPVTATAVRNTPQPVQLSDGDDPEVETQIAQIIYENSGEAGRAAAAGAAAAGAAAIQ
jgi:membrane fusion protein (multidrug efflux system)